MFKCKICNQEFSSERIYLIHKTNCKNNMIINGTYKTEEKSEDDVKDTENKNTESIESIKNTENTKVRKPRGRKPKITTLEDIK